MYESYYQFTHKPFKLTPDPDFFYHSRLHARAMSYMEYGITQAEGFIVVTGESGTGKTTIATSLLTKIEDGIIAVQLVAPKLDPEELVKLVCAKLSLPVEGKSKSELLGYLELYLNKLATKGRRVLLLVDEAQNLPVETIEELRMLSNFQRAGKPLIQSFLLGQVELQRILRSPNMEQFRQRIIASCHIAPLDLDETKEYVNHRLLKAGCAVENLISDDAFELIYQFTNGVPRKINTLMDRVLLYGFLEGVKTIEGNIAADVISEVKSETFEPKNIPAPKSLLNEKSRDDFDVDFDFESAEEKSREGYTAKGNKIREAAYYKNILEELVDAFEEAAKRKAEIIRYLNEK